jgi:hypothetical protein
MCSLSVEREGGRWEKGKKKGERGGKRKEVESKRGGRGERGRERREGADTNITIFITHKHLHSNIHNPQPAHHIKIQHFQNPTYSQPQAK